MTSPSRRERPWLPVHLSAEGAVSNVAHGELFNQGGSMADWNSTTYAEADQEESP